MDVFDTDPKILERLTPRQIDVVDLVARGNSNKKTALVLGICSETVRRHTWAACKKLGLENRTQLIVMYAQWRMTKDQEKI